MLVTYWSTKGGSGATVSAAVHALAAADHGPTLLVDLDGDLPDALGVAAPASGVAEWLAAGTAVPADALDRLTVPVSADLRLLGRGAGPLDPARADVLAELLHGAPRTVVVDAGTRPGTVGSTVARSSHRSILVTRACYLAVRRQLAEPLHPTEVLVVREPQRALGTADIVAATGIAACTVIPHDPSLAAKVDAGLLATRLPLRIRRRFRSVVTA